MENRYYKVTKGGNSAVVKGMYSLSYAPEKWTQPKIGKLFVFGSEEQAHDAFSITKEGYELWECDVVNPMKLTRCCSCFATEWFEDFWMKFTAIPFTLTTRAPAGTYAVDAVKLTRRIPW